MKLLSITCCFICSLLYVLLYVPNKIFSFCEELLIREGKMNMLKIGYLADYLSDELTTKIEDKKKEKERRNNIEKLVKELAELKEKGIIKKLNTQAVAEFYDTHKKQFNSNLDAKGFCKLICIHVGCDYNERTYHNFNNAKNSRVKVKNKEMQNCIA